MTPRKSFVFVAALVLLSPARAVAHHAMGGETPLTFLQGFVSGLAHPVIGLDHFLFLLTAGVLAFSLRSPLMHTLPIVFVMSAFAGTSLHLGGFELSSVELLIALSVTIGGVAVLSRRRVSVVALVAFLVLAGVAHGYAYAESIIGAQSSPLIAYLAGLALIQLTIVAGVARGLGMLTAWASDYAVQSERFAGGAALVAGTVWLALSIV